MEKDFFLAAIFIILAILADSCDGRAARALGVSGPFGALVVVVVVAAFFSGSVWSLQPELSRARRRQHQSAHRRAGGACRRWCWR